MHKNVVGILSAAAILSMLAGCSSDERTPDPLTPPVVKEVKKGMSREQVMHVMGKPAAETTMTHARGSCQTYILGQRDGKDVTRFVALDDAGHVSNSGYQTCAEYDTDPQAARQ